MMNQYTVVGGDTKKEEQAKNKCQKERGIRVLMKAAFVVFTLKDIKQTIANKNQ